MGIYGEKFFDNEYSRESKSVLENYIEDNFLESTLDSTAIEILDQIYSCENSSVDDNLELLRSVSEQLYYSCIDDNTKTKILNSLGKVVYGVNENSISLYESEEALLEFQGNPEKNKEYISLLNDIEEICNYNLVKIRKLADYAEKMLNNAKDVAGSKSAKKFKEAVNKSRDYAKEFNTWRRKASRNINAPVSFAQFAKSSKSFNNKYSNITMEEKKKLDAKLRKYEAEIRKIAKPWAKDGKLINEMIDITEDLGDIDRDYYNGFVANFNDFYKLFFNEMNYTLGDIIYVYKILDIKREKTLLYKIINNIIK